MAKKEKCKDCEVYDFSQQAFEKRLKSFQDAAEKIQSNPAPKSGYLDTQLFPKKDRKKYREKNK